MKLDGSPDMHVPSLKTRAICIQVFMHLHSTLHPTKNQKQTQKTNKKPKQQNKTHKRAKQQHVKQSQSPIPLHISRSFKYYLSTAIPHFPFTEMK